MAPDGWGRICPNSGAPHVCLLRRRVEEPKGGVDETNNYLAQLNLSPVILHPSYQLQYTPQEVTSLIAKQICHNVYLSRSAQEYRHGMKFPCLYLHYVGFTPLWRGDAMSYVVEDMRRFVMPYDSAARNSRFLLYRRLSCADLCFFVLNRSSCLILVIPAHLVSPDTPANISHR